MRGHRGRRARAALAGVALGFGSLTGGGCLSCLNPVGHPPPEALGPCEALPQPCRSGVYVFLIDGLDPFHCGNLPGVRDYLIELGFIKTYHGYAYHKSYFLKELLRTHAECPDARFVVVGFDYGAAAARNLACEAARSGAPVDLLVYLGGCSLEELPAEAG